ncbi:MAG TPA: 2-oxoglutarate dehydrogenase complex dihydrolipoyllysine-residue succinyltransferase [Planctomycetaceae bacterium]|nr:2-oxoglutarate dehydrogenase complex dihydrolipoyllysine-residue succinyltransferase [Planctomycetaceae bacterium]
MAVELKVPSMGESIKEVFIGEWVKREGDWVDQDQPIVEIESDKATAEFPAPIAGTITKVLKKTGDSAAVGEVIGYMEKAEKPAGKGDGKQGSAPAKAAEPAKPAPAAKAPEPKSGETRVMPAAARMLSEQGLSPAQVPATGPGGRLLKEDVQRQLAQPAAAATPSVQSAGGSREEEVVPMTPMRRRIAERLVQSQSQAALLTTFNEIDMTEVMALRAEYKDGFQKKYNVKLGFMSFFVKAAVDALKLIPQVNAEIRENSIVYHNYYDIGVAVGGGKGLVVPVIRNAERLSFAEVELTIEDFGKRARENQLKVEEFQGGTFTISNGGIYGSLLSTPIVNPPQSGILGLHAIQERPVARNGQVVIRSMMYVALTYDHRIVDGREAVTFLKRIKEVIENPSRMLLEV